MKTISIDKEMALSMIYKMTLIRNFENIVSKYKFDGEIYGMVHSYIGQEAVAVGVCAALNTEDYVISNHRPHGHAIAKGVNVSKIMSEIFGRKTGTSGGRGGSMHIMDKNVGFLMSTGIVGSGLPVACGAAFSSKYKGEDLLTCVFIGDGATNEGVFHECLNIASLWNLPLLLVIEDNGLAVTTSSSNTISYVNFGTLAAAYNIELFEIDGQDVESIYKVATSAINQIRIDNRPRIIWAKTVRFSEHAEGQWYQRMKDTQYRDWNELEKDIEERCPIRIFCNKLIKEQRGMQEEIDEIMEKVDAEIEQALLYALNSSYPEIGTAFANVYKE